MEIWGALREGGKVTWSWTLASLGQGLKVMVWAILLGQAIFFISISIVSADPRN